MKISMVKWLLVAVGLISINANAGDYFGIGVNSHVGQRWQDLSRTLTLFEQTAFSSIRDEVYWSRVEKERGALRHTPEMSELKEFANAAKSRNGRLVIVLGYGNKFYDGGRHPRSEAAIAAFADYCGFVAGAFSGYNVIFEIWNEWNSELGVVRGSGVGSASDYINLLRAAVPAIRAAAPDAIVISTGLARGVVEFEWLRQFVAQGGAELVDGFGLHAYIFNKPGWSVERLSAWLSGLAREKSLLGDAIREKGLYVTEYGAPYRSASAEVDSAAIVNGLDRLISNEVVRGVWLYQLVDNVPSAYKADSDEGAFGVFDSSGRRKQFFKELNDVAAKAKR